MNCFHFIVPRSYFIVCFLTPLCCRLVARRAARGCLKARYKISDAENIFLDPRNNHCASGAHHSRTLEVSHAP